MLKSGDINVRDPFILPYDGKYYLYGTRGETCWGLADGFDVYVGTDLENWEGPIEIFHNDGQFWADREYWAPEVRLYNGAFYLFASFHSPERCRGTQILRADRPEGPFVPISDGPVTPAHWECLDGTLYLDGNGKPWLIFCHEWLQVRDGEMCAMPLTDDLTAAAGEPRVLFHASDAPWSKGGGENGDCYVTDGPWMHRCADGTLLMLWSTGGYEGYAQGAAVSDNNDISGNWKPCPAPIFGKDGGHGMIFRGYDGVLRLVLHAPNENPKERPVFLPISDEGGAIRLL